MKSLKRSLHQSLWPCIMKQRMIHTDLPGQPPPYTEADLEKAKDIVLRNKGHTMVRELERSQIKWCPELVEKILKVIWNDGNRAIDFFTWVGKKGKIRTLNRYKHSEESYNYIIDILGRMRQFNQIRPTLKSMRMDGYKPTPKTFAIIMERYVASRRHERAIKVLEVMEQYGCYADLRIFNNLLDILCKAGIMNKAQDIFNTLKTKFVPDTITYNTMANGWCKVKKVNNAEMVLKEMVEKGFTPTSITYNTLLHGYLQIQQVQKGLDFFQECKRRGFTPNVVTYTTMIHGLGIMNYVSEAGQLFDEMLMSGCAPTVPTYNALIQVFCRNRKWACAFCAFGNMTKRGYVPNLSTFTMLVRALCQIGDMMDAIRFMIQMEKIGCGPDARSYNIVISSFCRYGEIDRACKMVNDMNKGPCLPNLDTYTVLLIALCDTAKSHYLVEAGRLLEEMIGKGFYPKSPIYRLVIDGLVLSGNHDYAKHIVSKHSSNSRVPGEIKL